MSLCITVCVYFKKQLWMQNITKDVCFAFVNVTLDSGNKIYFIFLQDWFQLINLLVNTD